MSGPTPTALAVGEIEGRWVVAVGDASGVVLVTGCLDGNTRLWDPLRASGARVAVEGWFPSVAMDADVVVAGSEDGGVRVWEIASGYGYPLTLGEPSSEPGVKVRLGGTHPRLLLAQRDDRVATWDMSDPRAPVLRQQTEIGTMRCVDLHFARGVPLLATLDDAYAVSVDDLLTGARLLQRQMDGADSLRFIDAPDHPLLGVGAVGTLHLLDAESWQPVRDPLRVPLPPHAAVGNLDGTDVLAALDTDGLRLYDLRTGELTIPPVEMSSTASGVAWGRVGDRDMVVTAHFATVRVWNPRTGRKITELRFGTRIGVMTVRQTDGGRFWVAVSGPGLVLTELREISAIHQSPVRHEEINRGVHTSEGRKNKPRTRLERRAQTAPGLVRRPVVRVVTAPPRGVAVVGGTLQPDLQQKAVEVLQHLSQLGGEEAEILIHGLEQLIHHPRAAGALGIAFLAGVRPATKPTRAQLTRPETTYGVSVSWPGSDYSAVFLGNPTVLGTVAQLQPDAVRKFLERLELSAGTDTKEVADPIGPAISEILGRRPVRPPQREHPDEPDE